VSQVQTETVGAVTIDGNGEPGFEPVEGLRDAVERSLAEAFGLGERDEVRALDPTPELVLPGV
jgi:hypothetical protein